MVEQLWCVFCSLLVFTRAENTIFCHYCLVLAGHLTTRRYWTLTFVGFDGGFRPKVQRRLVGKQGARVQHGGRGGGNPVGTVSGEG